MTSTPPTAPGTADVLEPDEVVTTEAPEGLKGTKERSRAGWFARVTVVALCLMWTIPSLGLLITSFRDPSDITASGWWTVFASPLEVTQWTISNYDTVLFGTDNFAQAFLNSITVALPSTVIPILAAAYAGYAFSWMRFKGRNLLFVMVVALLVIPLHVAFIPMIRIYGQLGINNTFLAVWLAHAAFGMPLAVYILKNYIGSLPSEIMESAHVDGASHFQIFWRLVIPLSVPALAAFFIFQFLWTWNDLLVALVFLGTRSDVQVLTVALQNIIGSRGQDWHLLTAGAFITMTVPLAVFFSLQRYFVRGLTAGSVKG